VCRAKNTHLFAKTIPANYSIAQALAWGLNEKVSTGMHPDTRAGWSKAYKSLNRMCERALAATEEISFSVRGQDLRKVVTALDFMCSYAHPDSDVRRMLNKLVGSLGYVGLAGVLSGEASTSKSRLWFENGRILMQGLNNTSGWRAMGEIPGIQRPLRGRKAPYSAPAVQAEAFVALARRYWPMFEESETEVLAQARTWCRENAQAAQEAQASAAPVHTFSVTVRSADFLTTFPWVRGANMAGFLTQLKTIPAGDRSYNPATRQWSFRTAHLQTVLGMARASGIFPNVTEVQSQDETPAGTYRTQAERTQAARAIGRYNTWHSAGRGWRRGGW